MQEKKRVIISLTSFPEAIPFAVIAIHSILNGTVLPDKVILYLTASQFPEGKIPFELLELKENKLFEVRFYRENIRSYTKLIPALKDFPNDIIVTIDDDILYDKNMLRGLLHLHNRYPKAIVGHRVREYKPNTPYRSWKRYKGHRYLLKSMKPKFTNIQTGVGGVLYPPNSLDTTMLDSKIFTEMAPTVDDIWFWAAAVAKGTKIAPVPFGYYKLNELKKPKEISLFNVNGNAKNDVNRIVLEKILEKYPKIKENVDSEIKSGKNPISLF
jgi:hypothetical protein